MKNWLGLFILISITVSCNGRSKSHQPAPPAPQAPQPPAPTTKTYSTETANNKLTIRFGGKVVAEIEGGKIVSESKTFVAYQSGSSTSLLGPKGEQIHSCTTACLMKVSNSFASVQSGPGEGVLYNEKGERIFTSSTSAQVKYQISDTFASIIGRYSSVLYRAGNPDSIYNCQVDCDMPVSNGFAAVIRKDAGTGVLIGQDGNTIHTFDVPGTVKLSNTFAALQVSSGSTLYHVAKGSIYNASVPVHIALSDKEAIVSRGSGTEFKFGQDGDIIR